MNATVKDVMTTDVVSVRKNATFKHMAAVLREQRVSAFPVIGDDNKIIGVVSEADMLAKEALEYDRRRKFSSMPHRRELEKAAGTTAEDLMTRPAVTVGPDDFVTGAARLMYSHRVKRLPVVDDSGHLIGIISRSDVLSVYNRPDADIRHDIIQGVILDALLADPTRFTLTVKDGIVTIEGVPETAEIGRDIVGEIKYVEGVVAVRDRLTYRPSSHATQYAGPLF